MGTSQQFDPTTGRLVGIATGPGNVLSSGNTIQTGSATVQNLSYGWDVAGNLLGRADAVNGVSESFTYDKDNRVHHSTIGSATKTYNYDIVGNLIYKTDVGTLTYPIPGSAQPHAVTGVTGTVQQRQWRKGGRGDQPALPI